MAEGKAYLSVLESCAMRCDAPSSEAESLKGSSRPVFCDLG